MPVIQEMPLLDPDSCYHETIPIAFRGGRAVAVTRENERGGSLISIPSDADRDIYDALDRFEPEARSDFSERYHRDVGLARQLPS